MFTSPFDFNIQIGQWLDEIANRRHLRSIGASPIERWETDRAAMVDLPPVAPTVGLTGRIRVARDYYVRIDGNDYSVDPRAIGRFVDWIATPVLIAVTCAEQIVATHRRVWTTGATITDPDHQKTARMLRADLAAQRDHIRRTTRTHPDGHVVAIRALPDYDALFGVDFDPYPATANDPGGPMADTTEGTIG